MAVVDVALAWTGWVFSAVGLGLAVRAERSAARERVRSEEIASLLSRAYSAQSSVPSHRGADVPLSDPREDSMRALLINVASQGLTLDHAVARGRPHGALLEPLTAMARELHERGLLAFEGPLTGGTPLRLNS